MKLSKKAGATSEIWQVFIRDAASTTGAGLTGLAVGGTVPTVYYHRDTDTTATQVVLVTMTVGTFTSSGFKEIDATNMPGWYQFCPPNAALQAGAKSCGVHFKGATLVSMPIEVQLTAVDPDSATAFITGVNSLAPPTNWNLLSIDGSGRTTVGTIVNGAIAAATFAANALDAVWATAARTITGGTIGTYTGNTPQTGDAYGALAGAQAEPVSVPAANASPLAKLGYVFTKSRNKSTQTATTQIVRNDADSATIATIAISDDTITFVKGVDT